MPEVKQDISKMNPHAAGIDIGSEKIFIGIEGKEVKSFSSFTDDYLSSISHLKDNNITTVAMRQPVFTGLHIMNCWKLLVLKHLLLILEILKTFPAEKVMPRTAYGFNSFTHTVFYAVALFLMILSDNSVLILVLGMIIFP